MLKDVKLYFHMEHVIMLLLNLSKNVV